MSRLTSVALAVVEEIAAGVAADAFAIEFDLAYRDLVSFEPQHLSVPHVSVVPRGLRRARIARDKFELLLDVDYAVQARVDPNNRSQVGPLQTLGEAIDEWLAERFTLANYPAATWRDSKQQTAADPDHLDRLHVFTAVYTQTYRQVVP